MADKQLEFSVLAVGQVACLAGGGVYLARKKVLTPAACRSYSKVVFNLFYPALLLKSVGKAVTPSELVTWWPLPVLAVLVSGIGFAAGHLLTSPLLLNYAAKPDQQRFWRGVVGALTLRTSAYMPIILVQALFGGSGIHVDASHTKGCGSDDPSECAVAYIAFYVIFIVIINWALMYTYLMGDTYGWDAKGGSSTSPVDRKATPPPPGESGVLLNSSDEAEEPLVPCDPPPLNGEKLYHFPQDYGTIDSPPDPSVNARHSNGHSRRLSRRLSRRFISKTHGSCWERTFAADSIVSKILNPPMIACIVAVAIGLITPVRNTVFGSSSFFQAIVNVTTLLGACAAPSAIVLTGASLGRGLPTSPAIDSRDVAGVVIMHLLVTPAILSSLVYAADTGGLLSKQNAIFKFVLFLETATPTNSNLVVICQLLRGGTAKARAIAVLCFWQYCVAAVVLTGFLFVVLSYLF